MGEENQLIKALLFLILFVVGIPLAVFALVAIQHVTASMLSGETSQQQSINAKSGMVVDASCNAFDNEWLPKLNEVQILSDGKKARVEITSNSREIKYILLPSVFYGFVGIKDYAIQPGFNVFTVDFPPDREIDIKERGAAISPIDDSVVVPQDLSNGSLSYQRFGGNWRWSRPTFGQANA